MEYEYEYRDAEYECEYRDAEYEYEYRDAEYERSKGVRTLFGVFRVGGGLTGGSGAARLPAPNSHLQRACPD